MTRISAENSKIVSVTVELVLQSRDVQSHDKTSVKVGTVIVESGT